MPTGCRPSADQQERYPLLKNRVHAIWEARPGSGTPTEYLGRAGSVVLHVFRGPTGRWLWAVATAGQNGVRCTPMGTGPGSVTHQDAQRRVEEWVGTLVSDAKEAERGD